MVRNDNLFNSANELRKSGHSYLQISRELGVPKSTLSGWFSKLYWSKDVVSRNTEQSNNYSGRLVLANITRAQKQRLRHERYTLEAKEQFKKFKNDPIFVGGVCLYWGEGEKTNSGRVSLINTDPEMLKVVVYFYRKYLDIANSSLRVGLFIYEDHLEEEIKGFWSKLLEIPVDQFIKTQYLKSRSRLTTRRSKYGICSLYFSSTEQSVKIREWIRLLQEYFRDEH